MDRRVVLGGIAAAIVVAGVAVGVTLALDSSPSPSAKSVRVGHGRSKLHSPKASYLYVTDAHRSTLVPTGTRGEYALTMSGVHPNALYYLDRPGNEVGSTPLQFVLDNFFGKSEDPKPNAAINAVVPGGGDFQSVMGVKVLRASYDPKHSTAHYVVQQLKQGPTEHREHGRTDVVLPRKLNRTALFIDNGDAARTCAGAVWNETFVDSGDTGTNWVTLAIGSYNNWGTDSWYTTPYMWSDQGGLTITDFESDGGFDRGCHAAVTLTITIPGVVTPAFAVVQLTNPWSGSNSATCTLVGVPSTVDLQCLQTSSSVVGGNDMNAIFVVCSNDWQYDGGNDCAHLVANL
jgi:hypothetical protein